MNQENLLDFDQNKSLPVSNYEVKIRHLVPGYEMIFSVMLALLHQKLPDQASLLIVGAGGGTELSVFGHGSQWQFTGIDPSVEMLSTASKKVEALGLSERVRFIQGTLEDVSVDTLFKAATSVLVMHFLPDNGSKLSFLKSIYQRLESGAPLFLVDLSGERGSKQFEQILSVWKLHAISTGAPVELIEEQLENVLPHFACVPEKRVVELLNEAGFTEVTLFYKLLMFNGWVAIKA